MKQLNQIPRFYSGEGHDDNLWAIGDILYTFEYILKTYPQADQIRISSLIKRDAIAMNEYRDIEILCENKEIQLDVQADNSSSYKQWIRVYRKDQLIAESYNIECK